ncbi:MAG TPA: hypothetical protein VM328_05445 [Fimbriimonadaceae bacterium]|nr:hypothetical protein [Fimbriimonadaceae bacterium]
MIPVARDGSEVACLMHDRTAQKTAQGLLLELAEGLREERTALRGQVAALTKQNDVLIQLHEPSSPAPTADADTNPEELPAH